MNAWNLLGIEPNADKKTIKIAYARLLKKTRPDEDPEGFRRLHSAYQSALNQLDSIAPSDITWLLEKNNDAEEEFEIAEAKQEITVKVQSSEPTIHEQAVNIDIIETVNNDLLTETNDDPIQSGTESTLDQMQQDWTTLFQQIDDLLTSASDRQSLQKWQFIETAPFFFDLEFKSNVSDELFSLIAQTNLLIAQTNLKDNDTALAIPSAVLNYLNELFNWEQKWIQYQKKFDADLLNAIYPYITHTQETADEEVVTPSFKAERLHAFRRIIAFFIDLSIAFVVPAIFLESAGFNDTALLTSFAIFYFLISIPLLEASHWQASLGKKIMGLQIVTKQGFRLGYGHSFWRGVITVFCVIGSKITGWIHLFTIYKYNILFHDYFTSSYVIRKNKKN